MLKLHYIPLAEAGPEALLKEMPYKFSELINDIVFLYLSSYLM